MALMQMSLGKIVKGKTKGTAATAYDYIARERSYKKKPDLVCKESGNLPDWCDGRAREYWHQADRRERANGIVCRKIEFALPKEIEDVALQQRIVHEVIDKACGGDKLAWSYAIHDTPTGNIHAHVMISERIQDNVQRDVERFFRRTNKKNPERGGCVKSTYLHDIGFPAMMREHIATVTNRMYRRLGIAARIDHRSYAAQGLEKVPGVHMGPQFKALEAKGIESYVLNAKREEAKQLAVAYAEITDAYKRAKADVADLVAKEREAYAAYAEEEERNEREAMDRKYSNAVPMPEHAQSLKPGKNAAEATFALRLLGYGTGRAYYNATAEKPPYPVVSVRMDEAQQKRQGDAKYLSYRYDYDRKKGTYCTGDEMQWEHGLIEERNCYRTFNGKRYCIKGVPTLSKERCKDGETITVRNARILGESDMFFVLEREHEGDLFAVWQPNVPTSWRIGSWHIGAQVSFELDSDGFHDIGYSTADIGYSAPRWSYDYYDYYRAPGDARHESAEKPAGEAGYKATEAAKAEKTTTAMARAAQNPVQEKPITATTTQKPVQEQSVTATTTQKQEEQKQEGPVHRTVEQADAHAPVQEDPTATQDTAEPQTAGLSGEKRRKEHSAISLGGRDLREDEILDPWQLSPYTYDGEVLCSDGANVYVLCDIGGEEYLVRVPDDGMGHHEGEEVELHIGRNGDVLIQEADNDRGLGY